MGDTNVSGVGGGLSSGHHHQLHHHQLHHHQGSGPGGHHHSSHHVASVGPGHHHDATALSFGLGFFPDPSEISSKSLPPFSSFGETEGLGEGLSGRLLDLGGSNGGPPPWDLYGEGLSARLIDVGAPTPLGLGIGVGVGLGLGFAPPPPSAVPAREAQTPNGTPNGGGGPGGPNTGPGGVQYRPWESKNHPDSNGNPPTLLELGRMMAVTPPPGNPSPNSNSQPPNGFVSELQLFEARIQPSHQQQQGSSPKLPSFQSQFQHSFSSPSPGSTSSTTPAGPPSAQLGEFGHNNNNNNNSSNGVRYPVVPAPVHPAASGHATAAAAAHPGAFVHHSFPASAGVAPSPSGVPNHYPLPAGHPASAQHLHQNGSSPIIKSEMDDSRSPFSSQGSLPAVTAPRPDGRKKEKRKYRASSMESSGSDPGSDAQVPSVSSTGLRGFKHPVHHHSMTGGSESDGHHNGEKQGKKKRKRCGECVGCMRKDNCAGCAPCRNDKSHQICKMRRCEKLTEKKIKVPREKGERTPRNGRSSNITTPQPSATPPATAATSTTSSMGSNPVASAVNNWDRGYTPNASWTTSAGPSPGADESNPWNNGYPTDTYVVDSSFTFQQGVVGGGFHPPAPVSIVDPSTFLNGAGTNGGYRPRPSPQPQQIQIGGFSPHHLSSPHPSPGSGQMQQQQQQNGRCGSVPPHYDSTGNNGHYSPRPPSNNPTDQYRNGVTSDSNGHPNGPPGYPSPVPQQQQQQQGSNGYSGVQNVSVKGEQVTTTTSTTNWDQSESKRATPHEELNNRLKEKILSKQQQQQHQQQYGQQQNGQYYVNYNYEGNNEYGNGVENHFNPPSASSPADNVRLDVHVEQQQQQQQSESSPAHFLGQAHPQSGGTGGGAIAQSGPPTSTTNGDDQSSPSAMITSPPRNANHHCPHNNSAAASSILEEDERLNKLKNNVKDEIPPCQCFPPDQYPAEPGPYYTQLGAAESLAALRELMERRTGLTGRAIRFEIILYTGKEGKTAQGCPIAKWIIRRTSVEEKVLCLVKQRTGHWCPTSWIIVISVAWEGLALRDSDYLYSELVNKLNAHGVATSRRCGTNEDKTCACQGLDPDTGGASFSFGCSWSMFYNGCKYARSKVIRKFRLTDESQEKDIEDRLQRFATAIAPLYKRIAPDAYENQVKFEETARDCRLGLIPGRPFAGVTACFDFCAHSHKDVHDMNNGCTVVTTLTKHRGLHKPPDDEQLHVLPHYILASVDENASLEGQQSKIASGSVEVLTKFPCLMRRHSEPVTAKNKRKMAAAQQQSQQPNPPVTVLSSVNEDAALLQSNQVSSSSVYQNGAANNWMQNGSIESRIRALSTSNSFRPSPTKPTFTNWGESQQYSNYNQQQSYRSQQQCYTQQNDPQWWNRSVPPQPSEMRPFGPANPIQPFQNLLQNQPPRPSITVQVSDNEENFRDPEIGGVAIALIHGSVLFECAKHELHATTALRQPDRRNPTRISLVLYQHHRMNEAKHGFHIHERKMELKEKKKQQEQLEKEQKEAAEAATRANMMMRPLPAPQQQYPNGMVWNQYQPSSYHYGWSSQPQHYQNTTLPPINHAFPHQLASSPYHQNHHLS